MHGIPAPARKFDRHPVCPYAQEMPSTSTTPRPPPHPPRRAHLGGMLLLTACGSAATDRNAPKVPQAPPAAQPAAPWHRRGDRLQPPSATPDPRTRSTGNRNSYVPPSPRSSRTAPTRSTACLITGMDGNLPSVRRHRARRPVRRQRRHRARARPTLRVLTLFCLNHYANLQARLRTRHPRLRRTVLMAGGDTLLGAGASDPEADCRTRRA